jgi:hypothetical protein
LCSSKWSIAKKNFNEGHKETHNNKYFEFQYPKFKREMEIKLNDKASRLKQQMIKLATIVQNPQNASLCKKEMNPRSW